MPISSVCCSTRMKTAGTTKVAYPPSGLNRGQLARPTGAGRFVMPAPRAAATALTLPATVLRTSR